MKNSGGKSSLGREPGEAFGVRAYSAALDWRNMLPPVVKHPTKGKRRNTRALQTLREFGYIRNNPQRLFQKSIPNTSASFDESRIRPASGSF
ncbi:MAG: hypothetical protein QOJ40_483 [Verrucomicrobiota bacterium]